MAEHSETSGRRVLQGRVTSDKMAQNQDFVGGINDILTEFGIG